METTQTSATAQRRGLLFILAAALLWGTVGVTTKGLYQIAETNPLSIGFFRLLLSTPALALASWWVLGAKALAIRARDVGLMALIGAAMAIYQVCYFAAIQYVGVSIAVLVTLCTAPVMVAVLSTFTLRESISRTVLAAMVAALIGTMLLVGSGGLDQDFSQTVTGVSLALGSALGYAVITLVSRLLAARYHPLQPITVGFAAGALFLLPFALAVGLVIEYPLTGWLLLLHLGLLPTALAYVLFLAGMRTTTATVATIVTLLEPLTGTTLAWLLFGEQLGPLGLIGGALLLSAIWLLYRDGQA